MNIIGNSCASSYITRDLIHEQFNNPFTWCSVSEADILYVMKHYDKINWENVQISLYNNATFNIKCTKAIVDSCIEIKYPHYCLSNSALTVKGINVYANNIVEWVQEKYISRIGRMKFAGKPFFCIGGTWEDQKMSLSTINLLSKKRNTFILSDDTIIHDNYKLAVVKFAQVQPLLQLFYNLPSNAPSSKST